MAFQRSALGIDLGARDIKCVRVRVDATGARIERSVVLSRRELDERGVDVSERPELAGAIRDALSQAKIAAHDAVLGLDAKDSILRYTSAPPLPPKRLATVMQYEVQSIADRMEEPLASDWTILPTRRDDGERTVLLGLAKEAPLTDLLDAFAEENVRIAGTCPGAIALYRAWDLVGAKDDPDSERDDLVVLLDLGEANLHLALVLNGRLVFARSASFGGRQFTEALAKGLGLSSENAERVKVAKGGLDDRVRGVAAETVPILRGAAGQLLGTVQSSIRFCDSQGGILLPDVTRLWVTGGGMRLPGLAEFIARALGGAQVERFDPTPGEGAGGASASLALALGLSAAGFSKPAHGETAPAIALLPAAYRKRREFRERTAWMWAAAALLALFLLVKLGHGLLAASAARETKDSLAAAKRALEVKRQERDDNVARSVEIRARVDRLLAEAEPTAFQTFLLDFFGASLRPEFQLDAVGLRVEERSEGGGFDYRVRVKGRVSNEKRKGLDWIIDLQEMLLREERIADVQVESSEPDGPWYTFEFTVFPHVRRI